MKTFPGTIIPAVTLTPSCLISEWENLALYSETSLPQTSCPEEKDFIDIEWNAEESIRQCSRYNNVPLGIRSFLTRNHVSNGTLLFSSEKLIQAWQQTLCAGILRDIECSRLNQLIQISRGALGWHQQARIKFASLSEKIAPLQQFSVRQWRLYWFLTRALNDIETVAIGTSESNPFTQDKTSSLLEHIHWHTAQLNNLLSPVKPPSLLQRIRTPLLEINRLCSMTCIYHAKLLRIITQSD
jgi:hypothetical protein